MPGVCHSTTERKRRAAKDLSTATDSSHAPPPVDSQSETPSCRCQVSAPLACSTRGGRCAGSRRETVGRHTTGLAADATSIATIRRARLLAGLLGSTPSVIFGATDVLAFSRSPVPTGVRPTTLAIITHVGPNVKGASGSPAAARSRRAIPRNGSARCAYSFVQERNSWTNGFRAIALPQCSSFRTPPPKRSSPHRYPGP